MSKISIPLEPSVASLYLSANAQKRKEANALVNLWIKEFLRSKKKNKEALFEIMEAAGKIAKRRGLTERKLKEILTEIDEENK